MLLAHAKQTQHTLLVHAAITVNVVKRPILSQSTPIDGINTSHTHTTLTTVSVALARTAAGCIIVCEHDQCTQHVRI
jgi:hypothetical protein